jgi:hypothetical protein
MTLYPSAPAVDEQRNPGVIKAIWNNYYKPIPRRYLQTGVSRPRGNTHPVINETPLLPRQIFIHQASSTIALSELCRIDNRLFHISIGKFRDALFHFRQKMSTRPNRHLLLDLQFFIVGISPTPAVIKRLCALTPFLYCFA